MKSKDKLILDTAEKHYSDSAECLDAFLHGVEFAESLSPWISVEDDLPYKHEELIANKMYPFLTINVLIKTKVRVHTAFMIKDIINDKWIWYGYGKDEDQITHWMPIP